MRRWTEESRWETGAVRSEGGEGSGREGGKWQGRKAMRGSDATEKRVKKKKNVGNCTEGSLERNNEQVNG